MKNLAVICFPLLLICTEGDSLSARELQMPRGTFEEDGLDELVRGSLEYSLPGEEPKPEAKPAERRGGIRARRETRRQERAGPLSNLRNSEDRDGPKIRDLPIAQAAVMYPMFLANAMFPENMKPTSAAEGVAVVTAPNVDMGSMAGGMTGMSASDVGQLSGQEKDNTGNPENDLWRAPHIAAGFAGVDMLYWFKDWLGEANKAAIGQLE